MGAGGRNRDRVEDRGCGVQGLIPVPFPEGTEGMGTGVGTGTRIVTLKVAGMGTGSEIEGLHPYGREGTRMGTGKGARIGTGVGMGTGTGVGDGDRGQRAQGHNPIGERESAGGWGENKDLNGIRGWRHGMGPREEEKDRYGGQGTQPPRKGDEDGAGDRDRRAGAQAALNQSFPS